jgi:hypothetical protein
MSNHRSSRQGPAGLGVALTAVVVVVLSGCTFLPIMEAGRGVTITNDTAAPVDVVYLNEDSTAVRLQPDEVEIFRFGLKPGVKGQDCTIAPIVVRDIGGNELARIPPPVCVDKDISLSRWLRD